MKKPVRFSTIGAFVFSALAILVAAIMFLGSGEAFRASRSYVSFFDQSVNGLALGAPVKFRGVEVGRVTGVALSAVDNGDPQIAVFYKIFEQQAASKIRQAVNISEPEDVRILIQRGLRAQLRSQSILSGNLYVSLDMLPEEEPVFILGEDSKTLEVPSIRSGLVEDFAASSADLSQSLTGSLENLQKVLINIDQKLDPLTEESLQTIRQFRATLSSVNQLIEPNSPVGYQLPRSLSEIEKAAKSVRLLAEYLERNPSSVIFGKSKVEVVDN